MESSGESTKKWVREPSSDPHFIIEVVISYSPTENLSE